MVQTTSLLSALTLLASFIIPITTATPTPEPGPGHPPPIPINKRSAAEVIAKLNLTANPEKGYFVQTFLDPDVVPGTNRSLSTAIYYLLEGKVGNSYWHRIDQAEGWHYYAGAPLRLELSTNDGTPVRAVKLGPDIFAGEQPQYVIKRWEWQRVRSLGDWTLVGTTGMLFFPLIFHSTVVD